MGRENKGRRFPGLKQEEGIVLPVSNWNDKEDKEPADGEGRREVKKDSNKKKIKMSFHVVSKTASLSSRTRPLIDQRERGFLYV